jgi:hypothetical protein
VTPRHATTVPPGLTPVEHSLPRTQGTRYPSGGVCNSIGGRAAVEGDRLIINAGYSTQFGCDAGTESEDAWLTDFSSQGLGSDGRMIAWSSSRGGKPSSFARFTEAANEDVPTSCPKSRQVAKCDAVAWNCRRRRSANWRAVWF